MNRLALEARYAIALREALDGAGISLPGWMQPRLPVSIADSMRVAELLAEKLPGPLAEHYLERAPRDWVKQRAAALDVGLRLLWQPIDAAQVPGFCAAIDGVCQILRGEKIDPRAIVGTASARELLEEKPCALQLISGALLASGLPLLGAGDAERGQMVRSREAAASGDSPEAHQRQDLGILDLHLGQHLVHELLHGLAPRGEQAGTDEDEAGRAGAKMQPIHQMQQQMSKTDGTDPYHLAGPPWIVREAAALWLQSRAHPRHVFPEVAGEAIPGVSLFVLIGEGLAAALGAGALLSVLSEPERFRERFGARVAALLSIAEWQLWLVRKGAPFAQDALRAVSWIKLAAGAALLSRIDLRAGGTPDPLQLAPLPPGPHPVLDAKSLLELNRDRAAKIGLAKLREQSDRAASLGLVRAVRELPSLLAAADAIPWRALDEWNREPSIEDEQRARIAVRALFQENAMAPIFVTRPAALVEEYDEPIWLEVDCCALHTSPRRQGVFAEPAHWIFPPPLCRLLEARGLARLDLRFAKRADSDAIANALVAMARASGPLPEKLELTARELLEDPEGRWTSSPR